MKLLFAALLTLLLISINSQNSKAQKDDNDNIEDYVDYLLKHKKDNDNIILGNNIHNRVQNNENINIHYNADKQNNKDHADRKESHKTDELSLWQRFKNWLSKIFNF
ncbi:uncharacterized protein LOC124418489 [Lucilia cuprina]|uniref:uncharacterized protein LOC124418489 n=1 Tax=Lucilia cuprina TaxID=7375 RepID=UPI001F05C035|nr:uncharacterized protein LOC124418489 [Lucilia cuprina]